MFESLKGGLIVSCQASSDEPFNHPDYIAAFARCAEIGGAVAIRTEGLEKIRAIKACVRLPVIGLVKGLYDDGYVLITPDFSDIVAMIDAGADIIAFDATTRRRPNGRLGHDFLREARTRFTVPVLADISTLEEGLLAAELGADFVATTLSGYTPGTSDQKDSPPDFALITTLSKKISKPVIAEGRIWNDHEAARALASGAFAVCVGSAITRPQLITQRFVDALKNVKT